MMSVMLWHPHPMFSGDVRGKWLTIGAMCFALFMAMLDNTVVNVALPKIQASLGSGVSGLQWIVDAYTLFFAALLLTGGTIGDLYGRKRIFLFGLATFTLGSLLCGIAPTIPVLILGRAIQGIGGAAFLPGTLSILAYTFPDPSERAQAIGLWAGVSALALAAGPIVGGLLVDSLGWQSVFFLNVPIGILAMVVAVKVVKESSSPAGRTLDLPGQFLMMAWLAALTYALIEGNSKGWSSPLISGLLIAAGIGLTVFLFIEHRRPDPMLKLHFFKSATFSASIASSALVSFGMFGILFFLSLFLQQVQGYSAMQAGLRFLPMMGAVAVTAPLAGRMAGKIGSRIPMTFGMALAGAGLLLFQTVQVHTPYSHMWWMLTMMGVGVGLTMTPMTAAVMSTVPAARSGMASATVNASRQIGGTFGIALLGAIVSRRLNGSLRVSLPRLGLDPVAVTRVIGSVAHGGRRSGTIPPAILSLISSAFVSGMHSALALAGFALLFGATLALVFVRPDKSKVADEVEEFASVSV